MDTSTILISVMNVALFLLSILYFRNGKKSYEAATARHVENMVILDQSIAESKAAHAKHVEVGELLREVETLANDIKSGKIKHVP